MKALLLAASAALVVSACSTTDEVVEPMAAAVPAGMSAMSYLPMASSGNMFEIQSSQLALQQSCDPAVRSYAQMMIDDHSRLSTLMMQTASSAGMTPPSPMLNAAHSQMLQRLQMETGAGFEAAYRNAQIMAHQEAVGLHRSYADTGDNNALRGVASQAVPVIEMHLNRAQSLPMTAACRTQPAVTTGGTGERG